MKCVIAFSCLLAVASAGYLGNGVAYTSAYASPLAYSTAYTVPIAYTAPKSFGYQTASVHPYGYTGYGYAAPLALASEARQVDPVAIAAGAPLPTGDTVEVAAAKAKHFQAHAAAKGLTYSAYAPAVAYSGYVAPFASEARLVDPVAIAAGAPLPTGDTVEVAAAKAKHFQAHAAAKGLTYSAYAPAVAYSGYVAPFASEARLVDPVAIAAGAPLPTGDTVEVAAAKAKHFQAHAAAKAGHFISKRSPVYLNTAYTTPLAYSTPIKSFGYSSYAAPLAYTGYTGYTGYGYGAVTPYFG